MLKERTHGCAEAHNPGSASSACAHASNHVSKNHVLYTRRDNRQDHQHVIMAARLVQSKNPGEQERRAIYGSEIIAWCAECGAFSSQCLQNLAQGRCKKGNNIYSVRKIMQGMYPLYANISVDTSTKCRIETVYQLTQRFM